MSTTPPNVLLRSEQSSGAVSAIEITSPTEFEGPPLHHHGFDEASYVLEGELTFKLRDDVFTRRAGELAFARRDVPHTYANHSDAPARALIVCTLPDSSATSLAWRPRDVEDARRSSASYPICRTGPLGEHSGSARCNGVDRRDKIQSGRAG